MWGMTFRKGTDVEESVVILVFGHLIGRDLAVCYAGKKCRHLLKGYIENLELEHT